jgi:hypothetical protein
MGKCTSLVVIGGLHNKKLIFRTEDYKLTSDRNPSTYCPKLSPIQRKITHQKWMKNKRFCVLSKYAKL